MTDYHFVSVNLVLIRWAIRADVGLHPVAIHGCPETRIFVTVENRFQK